jgi:hypothetical protein
MAEPASKTYSIDPVLYLYTSLTSGSSHIVTATSRLETILKANRIPFRALDIATDEKARMLWGRRAGKDESGRVRKIPGLVQMGLVIGDLVEIEDWNEYGELKQHVKIVPVGGASATPTAPSTTLSKASAAPENKKPETTLSASSKAPEAPKPAPAGAAPTPFTLAMQQAGQEAAQKAKDSKKPVKTFDGTGEAPPAKDVENAAVLPATTTSEPTSEGHTIDTVTFMQCPNTSAWNRAPKSVAPIITTRHSIDKLESLQSPNSTAWRPTDINAPVLTHRGSDVSQASVEEIRQIEEDATIPEEEEEDEEESSEDD